MPNDDPLVAYEYDALGRRVQTFDYTQTNALCPDTSDSAPLITRHVYAGGFEPVAEYVWCDYAGPGGTGDWVLAREFVWGERFPEPVAMIDYTNLGDISAGTPEVLHYVHDALGNVVGLTDAGDPDATPTPISGRLVERYDYDPYGTPYVESWDAGTQTFVRQPDASSSYGNPFLWTGQRWDVSARLYHFWARSYSPHLGRWLQRDPLGYIDGPNLYEYVRSAPTVLVDPLGLDDLPGWVRATDWMFPRGKSAKEEKEWAEDVEWTCDRIGDAADVATAGVGALIKRAVKRVAKKVLKEGAECLGERIVKKAIAEGAENQAEKTVKEAGEKLTKEAAEDVAEEAAERAAKDKAAKKAAKKEKKRYEKDPGQQYEEITEHQQKTHKGQSKKKIDSTQKSKQRNRQELQEEGDRALREGADEAEVCE